MKRQIIIFVILWMCAVGILAQKSPAKTSVKARKSSPQRYLMQVDMPAVFLKFTRSQRIESSVGRSDPDNLFFKLTNNTRWPIWLDMSGYGDERYGDARLYYVVEDYKSGENRSGSLRCHVCSNNQLGPGKSIEFSIPLRVAERDATMRIAYNFSWEDRFGGFEGSDTTHTVDYYFRSLPELALPKTR